MGNEDTERALAAESEIYTQVTTQAAELLGGGQQAADDIPSPTSERRRAESLSEPVNVELSSSSTVLYLAYGSNLCDQTFLKMRKIKPLSSINVQVPELRLTFDLAGLPYTEPCFANSARRLPDPSADAASAKESTPLLGPANPTGGGYRKDRWTKGLIGVVYEVTKSDYARIIATEGGGSSYQDILIDCYALSTDEEKPIPDVPEGQPFKVHTLFAPPELREANPTGTMQRRPNPSYAQPSARYLKLIRDGGEQRKLPLEYRAYLESLRPYTITTWRQRMGQIVMTATWMPLIVIYLRLSRLVADKKGRAPWWLQKYSTLLFKTMWLTYDSIYKPLFGDGERTIGDDA